MMTGLVPRLTPHSTSQSTPQSTPHEAVTLTQRRLDFGGAAVRAVCVALVGIVANGLALSPAQAKLPALSDEAKAKAAEAAALTAHNGKIANFQLCKSMDRVADRYKADAKKAGKPVTPAPDGTACVDPGPFVYAPPVALPLPGAPLASAAGAAPATPAPAAGAAPAAASAAPVPAAAAKK